MTKYADAFRKNQAKLKRILKGARHSDLYMVLRFINGLDSLYNIYIADFQRNRTFYNTKSIATPVTKRNMAHAADPLIARSEEKLRVILFLKLV